MCRKLISLMFLSVLLFSGCGVGVRQFNKGNYLKSAYASINRLKRQPDHDKALRMLQKSYKMVIETELKGIERIKSRNLVLAHEEIIPVYERLNRLRSEIEACPGCLNAIPNPRSFDQELTYAREEAAREHYSQGIRLMDGDMMQARQAHVHFVKAQSYRPDLERIDEWVLKSLDKATLRVLIEPIPMHSVMLQITNEFFENQIIQFVRSMNLPYTQFITPVESSEIDRKPHHVVVMRFDDFIIGQTYMKEESKEYTKDSVELGKVSIGEGKTLPAYGTVKATYALFTKTVKSTGLLDFRILDYQTGALIRQQKFPGTHLWQYQWATFNGDERALSAAQLELCKRREQMPPMPQDLFIEFTRPIFTQVTGALRNHYRTFR